MRRPPALSLIVLPLFAAACLEHTPGEPAVSLHTENGALVSASVESASAAPGGEISVRFVNSAAVAYSTNVCNRRVEERQGDAWVAYPESLPVCASTFAIVSPESAISRGTPLPTGATSGEFRFVFSMQPGVGSATDVRTQSFRVQ